MKLSAENISFRYDSSSRWILENVNFTVESHEVVGIFAPSGYGKSTFAQILAGIYQPVKGRLLLNGESIPSKGKNPVQLIYQHPEKAINPRWHMKKVLEESGNYSTEVLREFGIEEQWLNRYPRELSGGEMQRFCVARALTSGAKFVICDEISTMLDVITQAQIWQQVLKTAKEKKIGLVVVTHNLALAKKICTRIFDLAKGREIPI